MLSSFYLSFFPFYLPNAFYNWPTDTIVININLCEVLVLSDVRPYKNVTFCNV